MTYVVYKYEDFKDLINNSEINSNLETNYVLNTSTVKVTNKELFLCPYCNNGLSIHSSSGQSSVAWMDCSFCDYRTPSISINEPDAKTKCIEILKECFRTGNWENMYFIGEID